MVLYPLRLYFLSVAFNVLNLWLWERVQDLSLPPWAEISHGHACLGSIDTGLGEGRMPYIESDKRWGRKTVSGMR